MFDYSIKWVFAYRFGRSGYYANTMIGRGALFIYEVDGRWRSQVVSSGRVLTNSPTTFATKEDAAEWARITNDTPENRHVFSDPQRRMPKAQIKRLANQYVVELLRAQDLPHWVDDHHIDNYDDQILFLEEIGNIANRLEKKNGGKS